MENWKPKYRWVRTWGDETGLNGRRHDDWMALDGETYAGRILLEIGGPTKGLWRWAGSVPAGRRGTPLMPNAGYSETAAEAGRMVENYWDRMKVAGHCC